MEKLISVAVMRASDAAEIAGGTDSKTLMYRAGLGLFQSWDWHGKIDIVTGSGNNAGDGYVLALLLRQHGIPCKGSYLPLFTGDDRTPESWDFVPAESFPQILDNFHIPAGEPAQRLQMLADALREKMQFFTVSDADALPYAEL